MNAHVRLLASAVLAAAVVVPVLAAAPVRAEDTVFEKKTPRNPDDIVYGGRGVSDRSAVAGIVSLLVPGIGQAINADKTPKIVTHVLIGLPSLLWWGVPAFPGPLWPVGVVSGLFHFWSFWDALIDRRGGYIHGCVGTPGAWLDAGLGAGSPAC